MQYQVAIVIKPHQCAISVAQYQCNQQLQIIKQWQQALNLTNLWQSKSELIAFLQQLRQQLPTKANCCLALTELMVLQKQLLLPTKLAEVELAQLVQSVISRQFAVPETELAVDYRCQDNSVLIVAARKSEIDYLVSCCRQAGLRLKKLVPLLTEQTQLTLQQQAEAVLQTTTFNMLPWRKQQQIRHLIIIITMAVSMLLLAITIMLLYRQQLLQQQQQAQAVLQQLQQQRYSAQNQLTEVKTLQQQLQQQTQTLRNQQQHQTSLRQLERTFQLLTELIQPPKIWLDKIQIQANTWQLQGGATRYNSITNLQQQLQQQPEVQTVILQTLEQQTNWQRFALQVELQSNLALPEAKFVN